MFHKRPARYDVGVDINDVTISAAVARFAGRASCQFLRTGALSLLESLAAQLTASAVVVNFGPEVPELAAMAMGGDNGAALRNAQTDPTSSGRSRNGLRDRAAVLDGGILPSHLTAVDVVVYCDPPYLKTTRRSQNRLYQFEPGTDAIDDVAWHTRLLNVLNSLPCFVLLSGYQSDLYEKLLAQPKWRAVTYNAVTRSGRVATEYLWCNFPQPLELHDYRYLGDNKRERQRIRRKVARWKAKWSKMSTLERQAILAALRS